MTVRPLAAVQALGLWQLFNLAESVGLTKESAWSSSFGLWTWCLSSVKQDFTTTTTTDKIIIN